MSDLYTCLPTSATPTLFPTEYGARSVIVLLKLTTFMLNSTLPVSWLPKANQLSSFHRRCCSVLVEIIEWRGAA